jgi:hypothetical protein
MATQWISPTWRMPENSNQSKVDNYSLSFDGANDFISLSSTTYSGAFSISLWINPVDFTLQFFGGKDGANTDYIWAQTSTLLWFTAGGTATSFTESSGNDLVAGQWQNLVITRDSSNNVNAYRNGVAFGATVTNAGAFVLDTIGKVGSAANWIFHGEMGQVTVYEEALASPQIIALYNSNTPVNPMALTPLPTAYYPLGGGSTGSASTLTVPNNAVPSATVFDFNSSSSQYISAPLDANTGSFSASDEDLELGISLWFKQTSTSSNIGIFQWANTPNSGAPMILLQQSTTPTGAVRVYVDGQYQTKTGTIAVDTWNHVVFTRTASDNTWRGYLNGDTTPWFTKDDGGSIAVRNFATSVWLGTGYNGYWDGETSNFQVWNTTLSTADVTTLYNNGVPLLTGTQPQAANLKAWYKMNVDTSTWDGTDWIISNSSANYPNSLQFNGTSSYIDTSSFTTSGDDVTISLWLNAINIAASSPSTTGALVYGDASNFIYYNLNEVIYAKINGSTSILVANSGGVPQIFGTGNWHHLAVVKSGSTVTWYVDGSPFSDLGTGGSGGFTMNYIGAAGGSSIYFLDGQLSNVAIFESALDASAITTLYNSGQPETTISSSPLSWWKLDNLTTGIQDSGSASNNGTNNGATISGIAVSQENGTSNGMTTANLVTSDLTRSIPYSSYSMVFDGVADDIDLGSSYTTPDKFTISVWANSTSPFPSGTNYGYYVGADVTTHRGIGFAVQEGTVGSMGQGIIYVYFAPGGEALTTTAVTPGVWEHIVFVCDKTVGSYGEIKLYRNGILDTTTTLASADLNNLTEIEHIGSNGYNPHPYIGNLSNVAIWSSHLTEDQILTIYNGGVPNNISSLSPVGWWSLAGDSYFDGTNWICPDLGSGGNNGTSTGMGGTELVGDGPGSTANGVATSMDIPTNLKGDAPNSTSNAFSVNMTAIDRVTSVPG